MTTVQPSSTDEQGTALDAMCVGGVTEDAVNCYTGFLPCECGAVYDESWWECPNCGRR